MDKHDEDLLLLVAAHEAVVAERAAALVKLDLGEVEQRLDRLRAQGLTSRRRVSGRSPA